MRFLLALLPLLGWAIAPANATDVESVEIIRYGIYMGNIQGREQQSGTAQGYIELISDPTLKTRTDTVCTILGTRFGMEYVVHGRPSGQAVTLEWVTRFPAPGLVNPRGQRFEKNEFSRSAVLGATQFRTFSFDEPWEMLPGEWALEFHYKGRKLAEQRFTVINGCLSS